MQNIRWILFDCMETLIDLKELPNLREYALWAFEGSGCEDYWDGFEDFFRYYKKAINRFSEFLPKFKEYEMTERLELATRMKLGEVGNYEIDTIAGKLFKNYWRKYISMCILRDDVKIVLPDLHKKMPIAVVSNFMVKDGIEELLERLGIIKYFNFIITSINNGWRKPHPRIYQMAIEKSQESPNYLLFVGDNYECDYEGPRKLGLNSVLLDRKGKYGTKLETVRDFYELRKLFYQE